MDLFKWAIMRFPVICHADVTDASPRVTPLTQAGVPIWYQLYQCSYFTATQNISIRWLVASQSQCLLVRFFKFLMKTIQNQCDTVCVCRKTTNINSYDKKCGDWFSIRHIPTFTNPRASAAPLNPWKHRFTYHNNKKLYYFLCLVYYKPFLNVVPPVGFYVCVLTFLCVCA